MKRSISAMLAAGALLLLPLVAHAQETPRVETLEGSSFAMVDRVNVRNGDFAISYTYYTKGSGIPFVLTYNSLSSQEGWFGRGWGSPFETRMLYMPDGSAVVQENGTGAYTVYGAPPGYKVSDEIDQIVHAAIRANPKIDVAQYRRNLRASVGARFDAVKSYGLGRTFPEGLSLSVDMSTTFVGGACVEDSIQREELTSVFRRTCKQSRADVFDDTGHISLQYYRAIEAFLVYNRKGDVLESISTKTKDLDPLDNKLSFEWAGQHVAKIRDDREIPMKFTYDDRGNLKTAVEDAGNFYTYSYDGHNNMTDIRYIDDSHMRITYDVQDRVMSISNRDGSVTTYEYQRDFSNPKAFSTRVVQKKPSGATAVTVYKMIDG